MNQEHGEEGQHVPRAQQQEQADDNGQQPRRQVELKGQAVQVVREVAHQLDRSAGDDRRPQQDAQSGGGLRPEQQGQAQGAEQAGHPGKDDPDKTDGHHAGQPPSGLGFLWYIRIPPCLG